MSRSLRERWLKQLEAAQADASWQARAEARVLRFLLARYEGTEEEVSLTPFPLYEGPLVRGRVRSLLSQRDQHKRLEHIAQVGHEMEQEETNPSLWREITVGIPTHMVSERARKNIVARRKKRERGYW